LILRRVGDCIHIEEYAVGSRLLLSYWRDTNKKDTKSFQQAYKLSVHIDETDKNKPLQISHFPQILGSESSKVAQAITSDYLSIEKLLVHTIQVRSLTKLKDLERELRVILSTCSCEIRDVPIVLYVPLLNPCLDSEKLCIAVDLMKGTYLVSIAQKDTSLTRDIQECLNSDKRDLRKLLFNLKCWLMLERCRKSLQHQMVPCYDHLPLINLSEHPLESLSRHRIYAGLPKQPEYFLVIEVHDVVPEKKRKTVEYRYYLLQVRPEKMDIDGSDVTVPPGGSGPDMSDPTRMFLRAGNLVQLDTFLCTHGQNGKLYDVEPEDPDYLARKRKLLLGDTGDVFRPPPAKKPRLSIWFVPQLTHIIAMCEERLPLVALGEELEKRGIPHRGLQVDGEGVGMSLSLVHAPPYPSDIDANIIKQLNSCLLSLTFRLQYRGIRVWIAEAVFTKLPIKTTNIHEQGDFQRVLLLPDKLNTDSADKVIDTFLVSEWTSICHLYVAVQEFARIYNENAEMSHDIEVKSYNFKQLVLAYGPSKCYMATVSYSGQFHILFGSAGQATVPNCHVMISTYLEKDLNQTGSIAHLAKTLSESWSLLVSVSKLPTCPVPYFRKQQVVPTFSVIPQSSTHIRVIYRTTYCLDFQCRDGHLVSVRDGAYSMFETSKVVEGLTPIQNLQSFLNMYIDEAVLRSQARRHSTTEDDNPPSPIGVDPMDGLMSQPPGSNSAVAVSRRDMMIAPSPSSMLIPSPGNVALHAPSPPSFITAPSPSTVSSIHMQSPAANLFMSPQGMIEGSPYPNLLMSSPGPRNWPASPSMPGPSPSTLRDAEHRNVMLSMPSRTLPQPQRAWAASVPTLLSQEAISRLLTPSCIGNSGPACCPLERFLALVYLRRHLHRIMQTADNMANVLHSEPGVLMFRMECGLQFRVSFIPSMTLSLRLKVLSLPPPDYGVSPQWDGEELQIVERFFETKVTCFPYKPNALVSFIQLLKAPPRVFKDFVQLMKLELMPDRNMRWSLQWCLIVPLTLSDALIGQSAVVMQSAKMVFMLQLTRNIQQQSLAAGTQPTPMEPHTFVVPLLYNVPLNKTQMMLDQKASSSSAIAAVGNVLNHFYEYSKMTDTCSIYPAIRELLTNLMI
jgi:mediator of RNA polymerase II transcription subunit 14